MQCADEARRARIRGTLLEKYRKLVCLIEQCLSELDTTTERPTHTHAFICSTCVCVSLQKLCSPVMSKRNYEFAPRKSVSYFVIFVAEPFVNNFRGHSVDCQVVSDTRQLTANNPINQTSIASTGRSWTSGLTLSSSEHTPHAVN